ncbi:hypothetical protein BGZ58_010917 [Dissophora ornata]|nr:hypothetical protein BGZ58_010917 [Dissophora ornata]
MVRLNRDKISHLDLPPDQVQASLERTILLDDKGMSIMDLYLMRLLGLIRAAHSEMALHGGKIGRYLCLNIEDEAKQRKYMEPLLNPNATTLDEAVKLFKTVCLIFHRSPWKSP